MPSCTPAKGAWMWPAPPPWFYSSEAWLRWGWKCPRMALCWFSLMLEPSVAVKQSAIEFAHSGRTLNRKEGSGHSFWSYCLTTQLKQSNSSVAIAGCLHACWFFLCVCFFPPRGYQGRGARKDGNWLYMVLTNFWYSLMASFHGSLSGTHFLIAKWKESQWVKMYTFWKWGRYRLGFL